MAESYETGRKRTVPLPRVSAILFLALGLFESLWHYASILTGDRMYIDARVVWLPIAKALNSGDILYLTTPVNDNKTPLWHALNYFVYLTGHYTLVFLVLVGLANATVAYLVCQWLTDAGYRQGGLLAGGLYLASLAFVNGYVINVRSFSLVFLLLALRTMDARHRGIYTAVAVLFSQVTAFAVPVLLYDGYRRSENANRWCMEYIGVGAVVGVLTFLPLLLWSPDALIAGVRATFLAAGEYAGKNPGNGNAWMHTGVWAKKQAGQVRRLLFVLVPAGLSVGWWLRTRSLRWDAYTACLALALCLGVTLFLKGILYYWMPPILFCAALAGIGIEEWMGGAHA